MRRRVWLDRSPAVLLACCACGWRDHAADTAAGWRALAVHHRAVHDDTEAARIALTRAAEYTRRNA